MQQIVYSYDQDVRCTMASLMINIMTSMTAASVTINVCAATVIDVLWAKNKENDFQGCEQLHLVVKINQ